MKVIPSKTAAAIRKKRRRSTSKLRLNKQALQQKKRRLVEKNKVLSKVKKGFIEKYVSRNTKQLRRDDRKIAQQTKQITSGPTWKKKKILTALKKMNQQIKNKGDA